MRVVFSVRAEHELEEIGDYIAAENPSRAVSFIQEIQEQCSKIAMSPLAYVARPELDSQSLVSRGKLAVNKL
jgi:toxin ParE1/3/4